MKKLLLISLSILVVSAVGCSSGGSDEAPPAKGNKPDVAAPPPGMTGPGQRAGTPGQRVPDDTGEGTR